MIWYKHCLEWIYGDSYDLPHPRLVERCKNAEDFERFALKVLPKAVIGYLQGGAADERTITWNRLAFDSIKLLPRICRDVSKVDIRRTILNTPCETPIILSPIGNLGLVHRYGDVVAAKAAERANTIFTLSSAANIRPSNLANASPGRWFQLYWNYDRVWMKDLLHEVTQSGFSALLLTVDAPVLGTRDRERRLKPRSLPRLSNPCFGPSSVLDLRKQRTGNGDLYSSVIDPSMEWSAIDWIRAHTDLPIVLKGVCRASDATAAARAEVNGIVVSNHGGRTLDTVPATIELLPSIVQAVEKKIPIFIDGGIRRGTDILKCLALGAQAVMIGRPYAYALGIGGQEGITLLLRLLSLELRMAMALTGYVSLDQIDTQCLHPDTQQVV